MKISYKWLRDFVDVGLPADELADKLTLIGLELDGLHEAGDDWVLDIETTSNRGDCLSHLGVAREAAAATKNPLKVPESDLGGPEPDAGFVTIEAPEKCYRFTGRIIRNVTIGPSPDWLVKRLEAVGERSINNIADITNYAMHALGQPMHAFDLSKLAEGRIVVRTARRGEKIVTLDEVERDLDEETLVICDADKPCAVGGVMGGSDSGIGVGTTDVLIEVACFEPRNIRRTSRMLGLSTEASYRFERGVDIENLVRASNFASALILELAGGEIGEFVDVYPNVQERTVIEAPGLQAEILRLSGLEVEKDNIAYFLNALGIEDLGDDRFRSPSWRHDLSIEEDLVEEVVRLAGYDTIGEELPAGGSSGEYQPTEAGKRRLRSALATAGYDEAMNYSFIDAGIDGRIETVPSLEISEGDSYVEIRDPIIEGASMMRTSLLPGLLDSVRVNINHRTRDLMLFEIGKVFAARDDDEGLPLEKELLSIVVTGSERFAGRETADRKLDFFDLKGAVELAFESLRHDAPAFRASKVRHLQNGQSAEIVSGESTIGFAGRLSGDLGDSYKFRQPVYVAEIDLDSVLSMDETPPAYRSLPVYPSVFRDVTISIERSTTFADVRQAIIDQGIEICQKVAFVVVFEGEGLEQGRRALTIRLEYRADDRTLTEEEVDEVHTQILEGLSSRIEFDQR